MNPRLRIPSDGRLAHGKGRKYKTRTRCQDPPFRFVRAPDTFDLGEVLKQAAVACEESAELMEITEALEDSPSVFHKPPVSPAVVTTSSTPQAVGCTSSPSAARNENADAFAERGPAASAYPGPAHTPHPPDSQAARSASVTQRGKWDSLRDLGPIRMVGEALPVKSNSAANQRRAVRRTKRKADHGHVVTPPAKKKYVEGAAAVSVDFEPAMLPAAAGGYVALNKRHSLPELTADPDKAYSVHELVDDFGFALVEWDGIHPLHILDKNDRVIVSCIGQPDNPEFKAHARLAHELFVAEREAAQLPAVGKAHPRGTYPAVHVGAFHGQGTTHPVYLEPKARREMLHRLIHNEHVYALASFASYGFCAFQPQVYKKCQSELKDFFDHECDVRRVFPAHVSVYPAATFNLGPRVCTYKHRDTLNLAYGMCAVQALGNFDPKKGGHLVLWDLHKVVEFPPGALVLLPSALITHSNLPVAPHESRSSFTQYVSGGLLRWRDYGYQTAGSLKRNDPKKYNRIMAEKPHQWRKGLDLWSNVDDLRKK